MKGFVCVCCEYSVLADLRPMSCARCCRLNTMTEADVVTTKGTPRIDWGNGELRTPSTELAATSALPPRTVVVPFRPSFHTTQTSNEKSEKKKPTLVVKEKSIEKKQTEFLANIELVPFEPYSTHVPAFDKVVGGLSARFSILLGGEPGVGKSSLITKIMMRHLLDPLHPERFVYYGSAEEPLPRLISRIQDRCGYDLKDKRVRQVLGNQLVAGRETNIVELHDEIRGYKNFVCPDGVKRSPTLVIYDSITRYTHPDVKTFSPIMHGPSVIGEIVDLTEELALCAFGIVRLTKDGLLSGKQDQAYDVDCLVMLKRSKKKKFITLTCGPEGKNRMGPEDKTGWFKMTGRGILSTVSPKTLEKRRAEEKEQTRETEGTARRRGAVRGRVQKARTR